MPTVLRVEGFRFFFFSNEGHEPPHIHVESGACAAKYWLEPVALVYSHGYNSGQLRRLRRLVEGNKELFQKAWNDYFIDA